MRTWNRNGQQRSVSPRFRGCDAISCECWVLLTGACPRSDRLRELSASPSASPGLDLAVRDTNVVGRLRHRRGPVHHLAIIELEHAAVPRALHARTIDAG